MTHSRFRIYSISVLFVGMLAFAFLNGIFNLVKDSNGTENRKLASKPELLFKTIDQYPAKYEKYYNDNFSIRSLLIKYFTILNLKLYHISPIPKQVIIGDDNWLFYADTHLDSYEGKHRFTDAELREIKQEFEYRRDYLAKRGCRFYVAIAPVKNNIYSDKMPYSYYRENTQSWGEQINEYMTKKSTVPMVNLYPILRNNKNAQLVYLKLDTHWNSLGAFYATNEILKTINKDFPEIKPYAINDYTIKKRETLRGNLSDMLSNTLQFRDVAFDMQPRKGYKAEEQPKRGYPVVADFPYLDEYEMENEIADTQKPRLLLISDSFGGAVFPFLSESFSRTVKIFDGWQYKLNEQIVEQEKPQIEVLLVLESSFRNMFQFESSHLQSAKKEK